MRIRKSQLDGEVMAPPSKSHTMRAILMAAMADGQSIIEGVLPSPDTAAMVEACRSLGASVEKSGDTLTIVGVSGTPQTPPDVLDSGNSGQVLRFCGAVAALADGFSVLTGDPSIRTRRPVQPLLDGLTQLGAFATSTRGNGRAPILVRGPLKPGKVKIDGQDSQPVTALLIATSVLEGVSEITVDNPGETPWIDLTLSWLQRMGHTVECDSYRHYRVMGNGPHLGFNTTVAGDWSSAAYPLVAGVLTDSCVRVSGLDPRDPQGDKEIVTLLQQLGGNIAFTPDGARTRPGGRLKGGTIDINRTIDMLPLLALVGCFAEGQTRIRGGEIARKKESDRIAAIAAELRKLGADLDEHDDGLTVRPAALQGGVVDAHHDHRIAMTLAIAGLVADGEVMVEGSQCISKSFPNFVSTFCSLGADIEA